MSSRPWAVLTSFRRVAAPCCAILVTASWASAGAGCQGTVSSGAAGAPSAGGAQGADATGGGGVVEPPGATIAAAPPKFACDVAASPDELPLPRLSRHQLGSTLRFAIDRALPAEAEAIWRAVMPSFEQYPLDQRTPAPGDLKGGYSRTDQSIEQSRVDASYSVAIAVARELTATQTRLSALLGACATDTATTNDRTCLESFVRSWGSRVMRYPMPAADVTYFADTAGATPVDRAAVADVIATILASPRFLYRVEQGTADTTSGALSVASPLSAHELATRLSYQFWQAPPDDTLWNAAADGSLLTADGFEDALAHVIDSPRLGDALDEFVTEWLRLDELPSLEALRADPVYQAFAGSPLPTDATRGAMIDDVRASLRQTVWSGRSSADFLTDRRSYTADEALARIYGVAPWTDTGVGGPAAPSFASPARAGLLGRAALLATGTPNTRPIHRGYLIRNALLCEQVGAPPPNASATPPPPSAAATTRETITALTGGGSCGACHGQLINPQGFVLEGFDALGRERDEERLFDTSGNVTAVRSVDTAAVVSVGGASWSVSSPAELTRLLGQSGLFASCLARHYFRFSQGRSESATRDGCLLAAMESAARSGRPLADMLKAMARDATFKTRRFL